MMRVVSKGAFGILLLGLAAAPTARADDCKFSEPINKSYEIDDGKIAKCILQGKDPPKDWIARGGVSQMVGAKEFGGDQVLPTGLKPANSAMPHYEGAGCGYVKGGTKPGGKSAGGADSACNGSGGGGGGGGGGGSQGGSNGGKGGSSGGGGTQTPTPQPEKNAGMTNSQAACLKNVLGGLDIDAFFDALEGEGDGAICFNGKVTVCGMLSTEDSTQCKDQKGPAGSLSSQQPVKLGGTDESGATSGPVVTSGPVEGRLPDGTEFEIPAGTTIKADKNNKISASGRVFPTGRSGGGTKTNVLKLDKTDHLLLTPKGEGIVIVSPQSLSNDSAQYNENGDGDEPADENPCSLYAGVC